MPTTAQGTATERALHLRWDPDLIPPFPAVALKALQMVAGTDTSLIDLCHLVGTDPAFSAAILRIANSPLIAFPKNVTSVVQASILLGFQRLRSVVVTVGLRSYIQHSFTPLMQSCWRHSLASALLAERAAQSCRLDKEFAFTAGVLHDLGRIGLAALMPGQYLRVTQSGAENATALLKLERQMCGIDHCAAGEQMVESWKLPDIFLEVVAHHHETALRGTMAVLGPSCALADCLGFSVVQYRCERNYAAVLSDLPEAARNHFSAGPQKLAREIAQHIKMLESP